MYVIPPPVIFLIVVVLLTIVITGIYFVFKPDEPLTDKDFTQKKETDNTPVCEIEEMVSDVYANHYKHRQPTYPMTHMPKNSRRY